MRSVIAVVSIAALLVIVAMLAGGEGEAAPLGPEGPRGPAPELAGQKVGVELPEAAAEPPDDAGADAAAQREEVAEPPEWDPTLRDWLVLKVVDDIGRPVPGARIVLDGLRSKQDPGSHYLWRGDEQSLGVTDGEGRARVWFPVWIVRRRETGAVSFRIEHPRFPTYRDTDLPIGPGEHVVVLERGTFVTVSGWIGSPDQLVTDVRARMSYDAHMRASDWLVPEGRKPSTHKIPAGRHALYLTCDRDDGRYFSPIVEFAIEKGDQRDFHLPLQLARRLRGQLDADVPRPVRAGSVLLNLFHGTPGASMSREFTAAVEPDGTFELAGLPPGSGEIIGACDGWVSALVLPDLTPETRDRVEVPLGQQPVDLANVAEPFVLEMREAATLVATVLDPDGEPVPGATVSLWPNVHWGHGHADWFMGHTCQAVTGADGRAIVENLPPGAGESYRVEHDRFEMPLTPQKYGPPRRDGSIDLVSGEQREVTIRVVAKKGD